MGRENKNTYQNRELNINIWLVTLLLCCFGIVMIYSASAYSCGHSADYDFDSMYFMKRQLIFVSLGFICMVFGHVLNYNFLNNGLLIWGFYFVSTFCIFLLLSDSMGIEVNGAKRWLKIGKIQFQVAELIKIAVILALAYTFHQKSRYRDKWQLTIRLWAIGVFPAMLLLFISNDLSSSVVVLGITFFVSMIFTHQWKLHAVTASIILGGAASYVLYIKHHMPEPEELENLPFRVARIAAWINPEKYKVSKGYQVLQALYAVGSGGVTGTGLGNSYQKIGSIPEAQNDMIFSVICEELGVFGAVAVIGLIGYLVYQIYKVAVHSENLFGAVIATGVMSHVSIQTIINVSVNCNFFPNTGLPLPFFSYGGTSVALLLAELAIVISVERYHVIRYRRRERRYAMAAQ